MHIFINKAGNVVEEILEIDLLKIRSFVEETLERWNSNRRHRVKAEIDIQAFASEAPWTAVMKEREEERGWDTSSLNVWKDNLEPSV